LSTENFFFLEGDERPTKKSRRNELKVKEEENVNSHKKHLPTVLVTKLVFKKYQISSKTMSRNLESMISTHDNDIDCNDDDNDAESGSEEEELDPRVQEELEKLNKHTDQINKLEIGLEEANGLFRTLLSDSTHQLKAMSQKVGVAQIEKARPYFEALEIANKAQKECQSAATAYQRANGIHAAAKETIALAEERFLTNSSSWQFDNAWQEMLNHATMKVMEAEKAKTDSEAEHLQRAAFYTAAEQACQRLEKRLKKHVVKAQPYFEQKEAFNKALEAQKEQVQSLQLKVSTAKAEYAKSLRKLEEISESIHAARKLKTRLKERQPGVGQSSSIQSADLNFDLDLDLNERASVVSGKSSSVDEPDYQNEDSEFKRTLSCPDSMKLKDLSLKESQD